MPGRDDILLTPSLLREWPLPAVGESKYERGEVVVLGGARSSPGAAMLAGWAALRVGAGRLSVIVSDSVADHVAVAMVEAAVFTYSDVPGAESLSDNAKAAIGRADAVVCGPGLDRPEQASALLRELVTVIPDECSLVLDAFALGVLPDLPELVESFGDRLVLTPNLVEARLLARSPGGSGDGHGAGDGAGHEDGGDGGGDDTGDVDLTDLARRYRSVITCQGTVVDGQHEWTVSTGHGGLATSGSGDVLAGAITGLLARGSDRAQAACWGSYVHAAAGDRLTSRVGAVGFLAGELAVELPRILVELN